MQDDPFRWKRRLFASVDLAGSTAYKQRQSGDSGRWANTFRLFFREFPRTLKSSYEERRLQADGKPSQTLQVWKFVGDEILFEVELSRHEEALFHAVAFYDALNRYTDALESKPEFDLSLKGTLWGAGFPVNNVEVTPPLSDGASPRDYLGPEVDLGFRLTRLATARRIPVSIDLAYFLAMTNVGGKAPPLFIRVEEPEIHKGLSRPYPHLWIDRRGSEQTIEDKILGRREALPVHGLRDYLEFLFAQGAPGIYMPFIERDPSIIFNRVPREMNETRDRLKFTAMAEDGYSDKLLQSPSGELTQPPPPKTT